jgi:hypothetical protein
MGEEMTEGAPRSSGTASPRREMHFFWLLNSSISMRGSNIQELNNVVAGSIPVMRAAASKACGKNILVRELKFAEQWNWVDAKPTILWAEVTPRFSLS